MLSVLRPERGYTLVESAVAILVMGILLAAVYSVLIRVNQEASDQVVLADSQSALREAAHDIDVELRQATADRPNGSEVQALSWDEIQFLSYQSAGADLALHRYWLDGDCTSGCELKRAVYARVPASDPPAYEATALFTETLIGGILASASEPAFVGQVWSGATITDIAACDEGAGVGCDFSLVEIRLRADPGELQAVSDVVITEQVRIRNAK